MLVGNAYLNPCTEQQGILKYHRNTKTEGILFLTCNKSMDGTTGCSFAELIFNRSNMLITHKFKKNTQHKVICN